MSAQPTKRPPRGAVHKEGSTFLAAWVPNEIIAEIDHAVKRDDTDRSKILRKALRYYLSR